MEVPLYIELVMLVGWSVQLSEFCDTDHYTIFVRF